MADSSVKAGLLEDDISEADREALYVVEDTTCAKKCIINTDVSTVNLLL